MVILFMIVVWGLTDMINSTWWGIKKLIIHKKADADNSSSLYLFEILSSFYYANARIKQENPESVSVYLNFSSTVC